MVVLLLGIAVGVLSIAAVVAVQAADRARDDARAATQGRSPATVAQDHSRHAHEYVLVASKWYLNGDGISALASLDMQKARAMMPDWTTVNGSGCSTSAASSRGSTGSK